MDEKDTMSIKTGFLRGLISKIVTNKVRDALKLEDANMHLEDITVESQHDGKYKIHVSTDVILTKSDISRLVDNIL